MALWSVRLAEETRTGLTVYQLQELIRTGQVSAETEVSRDGTTWTRVKETPSLARALPEADKPPETSVNVDGLILERGPDGKLLPPTEAALNEYLARYRTRKPEVSKGLTSNRNLLIAGLSILVTVAAMVVLYQMLTSSLRQ